MRTLICVACCSLLATALASPAFALTGDEVIAKMDAAVTRAQDQYFEYDVINQEPGREGKLMQIKAWVMGEQRMTEFVAPGDMKGTKALVRSRAQMYIYLPAYSKVRRVASHAASGAFMGTTFSNDDISTVTYGETFTGTVLSEDDTQWVLEAKPIEGANTAYARLEIDMSKQYDQPTEIRYFNADGQNTKTEYRTRYTCQGEICNAESMKMVDHTRNDASTELLRTTWQTNTGLDAGFFSVRSLQE
jgi:hypothetical protein